MSAAELPATEQAEMTECDGDKVVTMMDVLQEQEDFEEDANAVLGASDEKNCTYPKGYIKRQALYACLTCCPDAKTDPTKRAGVCLACSLSCHENHELVELYTKRNFCCDCGNPNFNSHPCQFTSNKTDFNENNNYNQNFSGLYCVCHRPYPDPEATFEDEMIQCIICEDWLHSSHLEAKVPPNEQYSEMICKTCMEKNEFLHDYSDFAVNVESEDVDIIHTDKVNGVCNGDTKENGDVDMAESQEKESAEEKKIELANEIVSNESESTDKPESESTEKPDSESTEKPDSESTEKPDSESTKKPDLESTEKPDASMEVEQEQTADEKSELSKENDEKQNDGSEETLDSNKDDATKEAADDITEPVEQSTIPTHKPEEETGDSEDKKLIEEQNGSITDDSNLESKAEEKPTAEADNGKRDTASEAIKDTSSKTESKEEDTSQSEIGEKSKQESAEGIEKDDLLESIDRIINGDDEKSSEPGKEDEKSSEPGKEDEKSSEPGKEDSDAKLDTSAEENKTDGSVPEEKQKSETDEQESAAVNGKSTDENKPQTDVDMAETKDGDSTKSINEEVEQTNDHKRKFEDDEIDKADAKKPKLDNANGCVRPKGVKKHFTGATFWPCNFRQKLCTCSECITMYKDLSVLFLIDPEDTVSAYETLGIEKNNGRSSQYEIGMQALSSLDRIQQINALTEYNKMRDKLLDFLKSFKERKEVVKEEDIKAFFAGMKPKREPDGVYFCR